jgi:TolB protein
MIAVVAGSLLAGCGSTTPAQLLPAARGVQLSASSIPWDHVGPGWLLATWNRNKGTAPGSHAAGNVANPVNSIFLVDPSGGRYLIARYSNENESLAGWSGDARRALLVDDVASTRISSIDLKTGLGDSFALRTSNTVFFESVAYTRPDGLALLVTTQTDNAQLLQRYSLTGTLQHTYPASFSEVGAYGGSVLSSPDGLQLALGAREGIALLDNDGTIVVQVRVPGATYCDVKRWWATNVVLASCGGASSTQRLYEVPLTGGTVSALTATPRVTGPDEGDENAWAIGISVYLQDAGGCGYQYLARLQPDHLTTPVAVPGVVRADSVFVLGTANGQLALQATVACGSGESALWFTPSKNTSTVVLGPPLNGGGVQVALLFPDPIG